MDTALHKAAESHFDEMLSDLRASIAIPSILDEAARTEKDPFGPEVTKALEHFLSCASKLGFRTKNIDNMAGWAEIGEGELIGILAHLDVVPVGDTGEWKYPPFSATVAEDKLWGRGTADDKGPAFAALYAAKTLLDAGALNGKRLRLIVGGDEESGSRCMARYLKTEEVPAFGFSPDSSFPLINAEKGMAKITVAENFADVEDFAEPKLISIKGGFRYNVVPDRAEAIFEGSFDDQTLEALRANSKLMVVEQGGQTHLRAFGKTGHAMAPETGDNAVLTLCNALCTAEWGPSMAKRFTCAVSELFTDTRGVAAGIARSDEISGPLTWNAAIIDVTPERGSLKVDIRYPVTADYEALNKDLEKLFASRFMTLTTDHYSPALFVPPQTPLVTKLLEAYKNVTGVEGKAQSTGGGTYCRSMPNSVSFGPNFPGEPDLDHQPNEYITLKNLDSLLHLYTEALSLLVK